MEYGWKIQADSWERLRHVMVSARWRKVPMSITSQLSVPEGAGVYMLCSSVPNLVSTMLPKAIYNVLYVGKTNGLRRRFGDHCRRPDENIAALKAVYSQAVEFWFSPIELTRVADVEAVLIDCFGPSANRQSGEIKGTILEPVPA
jgi:excinuclease UvrABC nuclease subunit